MATDDLHLRTGVEPTVVCVDVGDTVQVTLEVENLSAAINGVQALFHYDTAVLTLVSIVPTDLNLTPPNDGWVDIALVDDDGDVRYAAGILGDSVSSNGPHVVATITFQASAAGLTDITFRTDPEYETRLTNAGDNSPITPVTHDSGEISAYEDDTHCCAPSNGFLTPISDDNACTDDSCDDQTGQVTHVDNYNPLTHCCVPSNGFLTAIDDANACTDDSCDAETGQVSHVENYEPLTHCCTPSNGFLTLLSDGDACTDDVCDDQTGQVTHPLNYEPLTHCCAPSNGFLTAISDDNACTDDSCDDETGQVAHVDNYNPLTHCCVPSNGFLTLIDDASACTDDSCDAETGQVSHVENFDPQTHCCAPSNGFLTLLSDGDGCTDDTCDDQTGQVTHPLNYNPLTHCCAPSNGFLTLLSDDDACTDDSCDGETGQVTHAEASFIDLKLDIDALSADVSREVTFVLTDCSGSQEDTLVLPLGFDSNGAVEHTLFAGDLTTIARPRDVTHIQITEGHTLTRTLDLEFTGPDGCSAIADLTTTGTVLVSGDFQTANVAQDNLVDIVDFSILATRWEQAVGAVHDAVVCAEADPAECSYGADATGDGIQSTADFTAVRVNFFAIGDPPPACGGRLAATADAMPVPNSDLLLSLALPAVKPRLASPPLALAERLILPGDTVEVQLAVSGVDVPLDGVQALIEFDTQRLTLLSVTPGDGHGSGWDGAAVLRSSVAGDTLAFAGGLLAGGTTEDGTVARLRFRALATGDAVINLLPASGQYATRLTAGAEPMVPHLGSSLVVRIGRRLQPVPQTGALDSAGGASR